MGIGILIRKMLCYFTGRGTQRKFFNLLPGWGGHRGPMAYDACPGHNTLMHCLFCDRHNA